MPKNGKKPDLDLSNVSLLDLGDEIRRRSPFGFILTTRPEDPDELLTTYWGPPHAVVGSLEIYLRFLYRTLEEDWSGRPDRPALHEAERSP